MPLENSTATRTTIRVGYIPYVWPALFSVPREHTIDKGCSAPIEQQSQSTLGWIGYSKGEKTHHTSHKIRVSVILVASVREGRAIINFMNAAATRQLVSADTQLCATAMPKDEVWRRVSGGLVKIKLTGDAKQRTGGAITTKIWRSHTIQVLQTTTGSPRTD